MKIPELLIGRAPACAGSRRVINRTGKITSGACDFRRAWVCQVIGYVEGAWRSVAVRLQSRIVSHSLLLIPILAGANVAKAQSIAPLVPMAIDPDYNRGRNLSVTENVDPNYQALGVRLGALVAYPSVALSAATTDNVYASSTLKRSDAYYLLQPAVQVVTDLPLHRLELIGMLNVRRHAHEKLRDQETYFLSGAGRIDVGSSAHIKGELQYGRQAESPFASDVIFDVSVLSEYSSLNQSITGVYNVGRLRLTGKGQHLTYRFNQIFFTDGSSRDQRDRNRDLDRVSAQVEYALSPNVAAFTQVNYEVTKFAAVRVGGLPPRSSKAISMLGGWNFDLAGIMRGSVAAGYVNRRYTASLYENQSGLVVQARADFFVSPLTTVSAGVQRTLQDAATSRNGSYTDTRANVTIDHALLRNLILSADATVSHNKLLETDASSRRRLVSIGARYQSNRAVSVETNVRYGAARPGSIPLGQRFNELSGQITLRFRR